LKLEILEEDITDAQREINALNRELEEVEAETARVQQSQQATQVLTKVWDTLDQLKHDSEIEDALGGHGASLAGPSSSGLRKRLRQPHRSAPGPSCISSGSDGGRGMSLLGSSSRRLHKRARQTHRPTTLHASPPEEATKPEPIYISSDSDGEHGSTPGPIER